MGKKIIFKGRAFLNRIQKKTESYHQWAHQHNSVHSERIFQKWEKRNVRFSNRLWISKCNKKGYLIQTDGAGWSPKESPQKTRRGYSQREDTSRPAPACKGARRGSGRRPRDPAAGSRFPFVLVPRAIVPGSRYCRPTGIRWSGLVSRYQTEGSGCKFQAENVGISSQPILLSTAASVQRLPTVMHELN